MMKIEIKFKAAIKRKEIKRILKTLNKAKTTIITILALTDVL